MKNFKLVAFVVMASLCGQQAFARDGYYSGFFNNITHFAGNVSEAVKAIFNGQALKIIDQAEHVAEHSRTNSLGVMVSSIMLWANNPSELHKAHDIRPQAMIIYGLGAATAGSLGCAALYKAYKTGGVKRLAAGAVGGILTTAGLVAAYRATQL